MSDFDPAVHGCVRVREDGSRYVFFERVLPHPVENVWAAVTEPEQLAHWFPGFRADVRLGGRFDIWFGQGQDESKGEMRSKGVCEGPSHYGGTITRCESPHVLQCGTIGYRLQEQPAGCLFTFTDVLWNEGAGLTPVELANSVLGGWHHFLDALTAHLADEPFDQSKPEVDYALIAVPGRD